MSIDISPGRTHTRVVADGVGVSFAHHIALSNVSFRVHEGDSVALIGPNGAGKTTLLRAIMGLVPASGSLDVLGTTPVKARSRVAYVPQADQLDADFPVSALQVVVMGRYRHVGWLRRPSRADKAIAMNALERVGLADRARVRFGALSGGQRQRVLLARALCQEAPLLLLDEPFNGVDVVTTDVFVDVFSKLRAEGASIVVSTHDFAIARRIASHICLLNTSQRGFGTVDEMLTSAHLRDTFEGQVLDTGDGASMIIPSHH